MNNQSKANVLPDCRLKTDFTPKRMMFVGAVAWVPIYCGNCGAEGGRVPVENTNFAFWLCANCESEWGVVAGTCCVPDDIFWKKLHEAQIEKYGRDLTAEEAIEALKDESNPITKLSKDRNKE